MFDENGKCKLCGSGEGEKYKTLNICQYCDDTGIRKYVNHLNKRQLQDYISHLKKLLDNHVFSSKYERIAIEEELCWAEHDIDLLKENLTICTFTPNVNDRTILDHYSGIEPSFDLTHPWFVSDRKNHN